MRVLARTQYRGGKLFLFGDCFVHTGEKISVFEVRPVAVIFMLLGHYLDRICMYMLMKIHKKLMRNFMEILTKFWFCPES